MIRLPRELDVRRRAPADLGRTEVAQIWALMSRSVDRDFDEFEARLARCDEIYLVRERASDELVGLLALHVLPERIEGRAVTILHAQWAFMAPRWRGRQVFTAIAARRFLQVALRHPLRPVWLLYSAATINSFSMVAKLASTFWVASQPDLPGGLRGLIDRGMRRIAGDAWDPSAGLLRGHQQWRYREGVLGHRARPSSPLVRRFLAANPNQEDGDAVVCLVPGSLANWAGAAARLLRRTLRSRKSRRARARTRRSLGELRAPTSSSSAPSVG